MIRFIAVASILAAIMVPLAAQPAAPPDTAIVSPPLDVTSRTSQIKFLIHPSAHDDHVPPDVVHEAGGRILADYGGPVAVAVPEPARDAFLARMAAFEVRELDEIIYRREDLSIHELTSRPPDLPGLVSSFSSTLRRRHAHGRRHCVQPGWCRSSPCLSAPSW